MSKNAEHAGATGVRRYTGSFVITVAICTAIVSFIMGTRGNELLAVVGPAFNMSVQTNSINLDAVQETYRVLTSKYDGELDSNKLAQYASKGMVEATGDPYTKYFTAEEAAKYNDDLSGKIGGGIGAELGKRNENITILKVLKGTPAEKSGLRAQDVILGINDQAVEGKSLDDVVQQVRGEVGTTVKLAVMRGKDAKSFSIERSEVTAPDISTRIQDGVGVLTVSRFDKMTGVNIRAAAEDFKKQGVKGVILDLRANGGGYLEAGVDTAGVWLGDKVAVSERRGGKVTNELRSDGKAVLDGMPTVVLIDEGSASASEIVAGALHDHKAATLVGEKSFGKGSVQSLVELSNGDELKVTVARWYTPNGKNINKEGIKPDTQIGITVEDINASRDPQLDAAFAKLKS